MDSGAGADWESGSGSLLQRVGWMGGALLVVLALGMLAAALLIFRRRRQIEGLDVAERVYHDLVNSVARLLRISPLAHQTPHEYGAGVVGVLPAGQQSVYKIVDTYVGFRFGGQPADDEQVQLAWRETHRALWRRWLGRQVARLLSAPRRLVPSLPPKPIWQESPAHQDE
jgi:hypothetical protein